MNWVWPRTRCAGDTEYWLAPPPTLSLPPTPPPPVAPSPAPSSSDDGGFLPRLRAPLRIGAAAPPLFRASSPAPEPPWPPWPPWTAWPPWTPWSPLHCSDLSSVAFPSSGDRSFPTPPSFVRLRSLRRRYSQELPSLRAIREEAARQVAVRPRARPQSRQFRLARSAPDLGPPPPHEASPESRSSSSGFGSKNASSSQHNRSSRAGSVAEWRPPPYRPPPPPPGAWTLAEVALDAGSVDGHYEFDRASPTPSPSTPERPRARHDDIEARVRAMKEEFQEFRRRQARRRRSPEFVPTITESAC